MPTLTPEQLTKLAAWGQSSCESFDEQMNQNGTMVLLATRKKNDTVRGHMRLLRTNLVNLGMVLPSKQVGWLRLNTDGHADSQDSVATKAKDPSASDPKDSAPRRQYQFQSGLSLPENLLTVPIVSIAGTGKRSLRSNVLRSMDWKVFTYAHGIVRKLCTHGPLIRRDSETPWSG